MPEKNSNSAPEILSVKWGKMVVETLGAGKDFKLWPGGGRSWNWEETGTGHSPGIQVSDCRELLDNGCKIVVLSRGILLRLKVDKKTLAFLEENNVEAIVCETKKAVKVYNSLVQQGKQVGGLFHSTC